MEGYAGKQKKAVKKHKTPVIRHVSVTWCVMYTKAVNRINPGFSSQGEFFFPFLILSL